LNDSIADFILSTDIPFPLTKEPFTQHVSHNNNHDQENSSIAGACEAEVVTQAVVTQGSSAAPAVYVPETGHMQTANR
jgi:hypothetical protein